VDDEEFVALTGDSAETVLAAAPADKEEPWVTSEDSPVATEAVSGLYPKMPATTSTEAWAPVALVVPVLVTGVVDALALLLLLLLLDVLRLLRRSDTLLAPAEVNRVRAIAIIDEYE
jgi:hypothetical protein